MTDLAEKIGLLEPDVAFDVLGRREVFELRDYSGARGAVPGRYRAHDWQTCRVLRELGELWALYRWSALPPRPHAVIHVHGLAS